MIWGALWAAGVVAFLLYFFRGHLRWLLWWVLGLVALIASAFLQWALMAHEGYGEFVETASRAGWAILFVALAALASAMIAGIVYTLHRGRPRRRGEIVSERRAPGAMFLGIPPPAGWSKRRILGGARHAVTMESLADGSASLGDRLLVLDIVVVFAAFFLAWLGLGLILMEKLLILALVPVLPGLWVYANLREDWRLYREAKRKVAANEAEDR
jgi:hypothetical protein